MVGTSAQSIEELFLGHQQTSTLEGRVAASVSLLVCFGSAISMILNALFTTVEQTSLSAIGTILGGAVYLYLRKTGRWEPLALPGCLAFLAVVSVAWATDTGSYSTAGFFFFMVATVAAIILRRRHVPWFVTLMILTSAPCLSESISRRCRFRSMRSPVSAGLAIPLLPSRSAWLSSQLSSGLSSGSTSGTRRISAGRWMKSARSGACSLSARMQENTRPLRILEPY